MKLKILFSLIFFSLTTFAAPQKKSEFIGYKHKGVLYGETLPNGVKDLGGGLLSNENYGVSRFQKGKKFMLWLEKITSRDAKGVPSWEVKDVLTFDNLKKNQEFSFSYSSTCRQNGKENLDLIVMTELSAQRKIYKVIRAWQANVKTAKFEKISEKGIVCRYVEPEKK
jgi:hypothetical protein